jgi:Fe-S oxidoreductase
VRCIGLGACRKKDGGAMCPSYMVTLEEEHSTRGRAHMLFELLQGEVVRDVWKDQYVKRALDMCLSCKACKSECPVNVDMATYKAEFLSHFYEGKLRPLDHYVLGMIDKWARMASYMPGVANSFAHTTGLSHILKKVLHLATERRLPRFSSTSFQQWARKHGLSDTKHAEKTESIAVGHEVILWVDTFNNYFHPETAQAAVEVLEAARFHVRISRPGLCCGRPLYDFGMLNSAKKYLHRILQVLSRELDAGIPVVVLEPSCASVFRDELPNLLPSDSRAARLRSQIFLLSEFLENQARDYAPPPLARKVMLHGHCHQKALMKMTSEESLLRKMGVELHGLDSGCCGMAGAFGFHQDRFAISQAIGERVLFPALRSASDDTLVVADGFSCREQIRQGTGRGAMHFAEVIKLALSPEPARKQSLADH